MLETCAAAAPLTVTVQTALLGQSSTTLAAFAAVNTSANLACFLFNFLVDGVTAALHSWPWLSTRSVSCCGACPRYIVQLCTCSAWQSIPCLALSIHSYNTSLCLQVAAKVGQSAGARDYRGARHRARLALACSLGAGGLAAVALASLQRPISAFLHLEPEVCACVCVTRLCLRSI